MNAYFHLLSFIQVDFMKPKITIHLVMSEMYFFKMKILKDLHILNWLLVQKHLMSDKIGRLPANDYFTLKMEVRQLPNLLFWINSSLWFLLQSAELNWMVLENWKQLQIFVIKSQYQLLSSFNRLEGLAPIKRSRNFEECSFQGQGGPNSNWTYV